MVLQEGMVVGLDISPGEVRHATARAESRGVANVKVATPAVCDTNFMFLESLKNENWNV